MAQTKIEWTATRAPDGAMLPGYTFNPWVGCQKVSDACDHCYAEGWAKRAGQAHLWTGDRRRTSDANWRQPLKWNRQAAVAGVRRRVFCASLADVFDNQVPPDWRADLWNLIAETQQLDWLLLTKRPQNIVKMLPVGWCNPGIGRSGFMHVWLGTTAENQQEADRRIPHLLGVPARVHFLSCEPLLGPLNLTNVAGEVPEYGRSRAHGTDVLTPYNRSLRQQVDWVICGGESGPQARMMDPEWARSLRDQCAAAGVPFFMKQMTRKEAIPQDLLVREWPA